MTEPETKVQRRMEAKALFSAAVLAAGSTLAAVARAVGIDPSRLERKVSTKHPDQVPTLVDIIGAPSSVRREVALALLAEEAPAARMAPLDHLVRLTVEAGDVARAVMEAGTEVDDDEAALIDRELADLGAAVERARCDLRAKRAR